MPTYACSRCADGGIFAETELKAAFEDGQLGIPEDRPLPNDTEPVPFAIVADDAFPLKHWLLKPYSQRILTHDQRIFNYRLCRARHVVENAFGILANRWRVLAKRIDISPSRVELVVLAACALHNMIVNEKPQHLRRMADREDPEKHNVTDGTWRDGPVMTQLEALRGNNATKKGKAYREYLTAYFNSDAGSVPWQERQSRHIH